jgi:hypothetical protein
MVANCADCLKIVKPRFAAGCRNTTDAQIEEVFYSSQDTFSFCKPGNPLPSPSASAAPCPTDVVSITLDLASALTASSCTSRLNTTNATPAQICECAYDSMARIVRPGCSLPANLDLNAAGPFAALQSAYGCTLEGFKSYRSRVNAAPGALFSGVMPAVGAALAGALGLML